MPRAFALMSSNAFSIAPIACCAMPPDDCRRIANMNATSASYARGSLPMIDGASRSITADTPGPPNDSLYSLQPTSPASVVIFRKSKLRWPASAWSDSTLVIFMLPASNDGDRFDLDYVVGMRERGEPDHRRRRPFLAPELVTNLAERRPLADVGEIRRDLDDIGERAARRFDLRFHGAEHGARLALEVAGMRGLAVLVVRDLPGEEDDRLRAGDLEALGVAGRIEDAGGAELFEIAMTSS